ncbi:hypothetical protein EV421DRAFT_1736882 [Armillaria borealis]|uniref:Uncharacterized protein n=1 Tax=Armillaria borealis TaxID=47425 RepID=A0AA39JFH9_9AGAR|nr:hypothetical protein EV421DRAFT_1736882 [Armillaria borealis]
MHDHTPLLVLWSLPETTPSYSLVSLDGTETIMQSAVKISLALLRAAKARESTVKPKRHAGSDDVFDDAMDDDKEETEDKVLKDEFFRRIVEHASRLTQHAYERSYADEVGPSLESDMADLGAWEDELHGTNRSCTEALLRQEELTPEEREIAELQAYADECEQQATMADFEDVPEEFWDDSDLDEGEVDAMVIS